MASESKAWRQVQDIAHQLGGSTSPETRAAARSLHQLAREMRAQLVVGIHENPMLAIVGNPPRRRARSMDGDVWSRRVYAIQYKHARDGKNYEHEFQPGVCLHGNADGTVTIYRNDGRPVWEEFPG